MGKMRHDTSPKLSSSSLASTKTTGFNDSSSRGPRSLSPSTSPHQSPSSPLRPISGNNSNIPGPSRNYAFPSERSSPSPLAATSPLASTAQHRMSQSFGRSRRPSPLLHEIQPPSRRLSAHQMLLLTPFGGAIPPGALIRPVEGVARIASSIGASLSLLTAPQRSFGSSSAMRVALGSIGPPRLRHHSLVNPPAAPSPLSSAPMTTIQSASEYSSSESASNASQPGIPNQGENSTTGTLGTVAMTRSNSGPVLTLRELQALQQKDGELGIARGGEWAWMSREGTDDDSIDESVEDETPDLTAGNTVSASSTSLVSNISTTPPSRFPFTNGFHDPFAPHPSFPAAGMVRETASFTPPHLPLSTSPYYSPTTEARRMSEIPLPLENYSPGSCRHLDPTGRPSASVARGTIPISRASIQSLTSANSNPTPRTSFAPPRTESPRGTPIPSHGRPRMMRYRSSPGRSTDLGLQIVVRPQPSTSGPSSGEPGFNSPSSSPASSLRRRGGRYRQRGSWTSVDVVDPLAAGADDSSSTSSRGLALLLVERRSTLAQKTEFGGRNRFESVDSALPLFGGKFLNLPQTATGWSETFPRRGSLAVLSRTPSGPWAIKGGEQGLSAGHWSERRGSWAEIWGKT